MNKFYNIPNRLGLILSGFLYLLFNLRIGGDTLTTFKATGLQLVSTVPYVAGMTYVFIAFLQYMAGGEKLPWDRRLRIFFAVGILGGLLMAIYEYGGIGR
ncbi:MAG: hypothetical protein CSA21_06970 [Deltaproteobacteria bacterium]|nr:MAG: hypothetical protein CSA21_06970 [Deltaproteobacteria bacterium]